jgi:ribonuclease HI
MNNQIKEYTIYTDGSSTVKKINDIRFGGIGVFCENANINLSKGYKSTNVTNQRMELLACIEGINIVVQQNIYAKINIKTDSMYTINCVTKWINKWKKDGWTRNGKPICNLDLIKKLYILTNKYDINYFHVRSHQIEPNNKKLNQWINWNGNNIADILARSAMTNIRKI